MKIFCRQVLSALPVLLIALTSSPARADKVCIKAELKKGKIAFTRRVVTGNKCSKGFTEVSATTIPAVYGDGSAGAYPGSVGLTGLFSSATITSDTVPSGLTLRSTGDCTISGQLVVRNAAFSGLPADTNNSPLPPVSGISLSHAANGQLFSSGGPAILYGGSGGTGVKDRSSQVGLFGSLILAGGGGGGSVSGVENAVSGGGGLRLICRGTIRITSSGSILANGRDGTGLQAGGGGGGVIILISGTEIINEGTISAAGGNGDDGAAQNAASGGGGGGLIRFIAPKVTAGSCNVAGGTAGAPQSIVDINQSYSSGGGGGASVGDGGKGSTVNEGGSTTAAGNGTAGTQDQIITSSPETFAT